jgi:hypothetical protein
MIYSQGEVNVFFQKIQQKYVKIELLNKDELKIVELQGRVIDGNVDITNDNAVRRTCRFTMVVQDDKLIPRYDGYIWLDKKIRVHTGVKDMITDEIYWFDKGLFIMNSPSLVYDMTKKTIDIEGLDYACLCNGTLGGQLLLKTKINVNTPINDALKSTIQLAGFNKFNLEENTFVLPYDIEKSADNTIWDIVDEIKNLFMGYEAYFDNNGYFVFQKIKDRKNDVVDWVFENDELLINYKNAPNFENVRNKVIVYGRVVEDGTQIMSTLSNTNSSNPFSVPVIGERPIVISDDKIFTQAQADLRAEYELEQHSNLQEKISITSIPILKLDVNKVNEFSNSGIDIGINEKYLVDRISVGLKVNSTMQIDCHKLYV